MSLGYYKWYQSQTPGGVPTRMLDPKGVNCEIPRWLERRTEHSLYGCGNFSLVDTFLNLEGKLKRESTKKTISGPTWTIGLLHIDSRKKKKSG